MPCEETLPPPPDALTSPCGVSRRRFLLRSGAAAAFLAVPAWMKSSLLGGPEPVLSVTPYPRLDLASLDELETGQPREFRYPWDHPHCSSFLVKLDERAAGGVGPERDVVAFNALCTHQGGPLSDRIHARHEVAGPCPVHLSTFDLRRHGMVVAGQATESLPQVVLEVIRGRVIAVGMAGLLYGFHDNREEPAGGIPGR